MSKSKAAAERRMLDTNINTDDTSCDVISNKVTDFLTKNEQKELFRKFLKERRIEEKRRYRMKKSFSQQLLDHSEGEIDCNEDYDNTFENYEDEYYDDFNEDKR